jgi:hypothetical protein
MNPDPSLVARIWEWFWAVVWNWKGLVAGLSLATGFFPKLLSERARQWLVQLLPEKARQWLVQLLPEKARQWLCQTLGPDFRRRGLVMLCLLFLLMSFFQVYDDVSARLRHISAELPDFNKVTTWSVSFQTFIASEALSSDIRPTSFVLLHRCRFTNLSNTLTRILDIKIILPTNDPEIPTVTLDTQNMSFLEYRRSFTDKGLAVDESAGGE